VTAISAPPRPGGKSSNDAIQDLSTGSGGYTNTNQEIRRIVPDANGRTVVRPCRQPGLRLAGATGRLAVWDGANCRPSRLDILGPGTRAAAPAGPSLSPGDPLLPSP
jgi:hypothetical protein